MIKKIIKRFNSLSEVTKLIFFTGVSLFILTIVFEHITLIWADNPVQKIVWAPISEEPFKLSLAFIFSFIIIEFWFIIRKEINMLNAFSFCFIPSSIVAGTYFGVLEGAINNILLHISTTLLAALFLIWVFRWLKNKKIRLKQKLLFVFPILGISMFFHSVSNQYANICVADNYPKYELLVTIARFLENNTALTNQILFILALFLLTLMILIVCILKYIILPFTFKDIGNNDSKRILETFFHIIAIFMISIGLGNFLGSIFNFPLDGLFWMSIALIQAFAALLAIIMVIITYNLQIVDRTFLAAAERGEPRPARVTTLNENMENLRSRIYPFVISAGSTIIISLVLLIIMKFSLITSDIPLFQNVHITISMIFLVLLSIYTIYLLIKQIKAILILEAR